MVRRIVTPRGTGVRGKFPSQKNGEMIYWESTLERDFCFLLEFSLGLRSFTSQPRRFETKKDGETRKHIPDFEVVCVDGAIGYVEVKPLTRLQNLEVRENLDRLENELVRQGYFYQIATEEKIRQQPRLDNLKRIFSYRTFAPPAITPEVRKNQPEEPMSFGDFIERIGCLAQAYSYLGNQLAVFDLQKPLDEKTIIWIPEAEVDETNLF